MKIQLLRNATLRLTYGGYQLLIDPYLAPALSLPSYTGRSANPLVSLPCTPRQAIAGAELVLVSHLHSDHFDNLAQAMLPKTLPLFCQPGDETYIRGKGFTNVAPLQDGVDWGSITINRTDGLHGSSESILQIMGRVSGFVLRAEGEPTLYWAGDTVLYEEVLEAVQRWQPDVIVSHSGGAVWGEGELIIMDAAQTVTLCQAAPQSRVIAVHMEALDHCTTSRAALRDAARPAGIDDSRLLIPRDGEELEIG